MLLKYKIYAPGLLLTLMSMVLSLLLSLFFSLLIAMPASAQKSRSNSPVSNKKQPKQIRTPTSNTYYRVAEKLFRSGQYGNAIRYAAAHLRKVPGHKPSLVILARSYYRLGKSSLSVSAFSKLEFDDLSADALVEFTLAAFAAKKYKVSAVLWQRVPENHVYKDISKFYAGVSYLNLRQYPKASSLLRSAKKLPASLKADRRRLLDEVDALMESERGGLFAPERPFVYQSQSRTYAPQIYTPPSYPPSPQSPTPSAPGQPSPPSSQKEAASPPPSEGFMATATPTFAYEITSQSIDRNGYVLEQRDSRKPSVALPISIKYAARPRPFGGQSSFTLNITPGYDDTETTSASSELLAAEDTPDVVQNQVTMSAGHFYNQTLNVSAELFFPVSEPLDLILGYRSDHQYIDASQKKEISKEGPSIKVAGEGDLIKMDVSFSSIETQNKANAELEKPTKLDSTNTIVGSLTRNGDSSVVKIEGSSAEVASLSKSGLKATTNGKINWDKSIGDFGLGIGGLYTSRTTYAESILSPDGQTARGEQGGSATLKWSLDFGLTLTGGVTYIMFTDLDYSTGADETFEVFPSNGTATTYSLLASAPIFGSYGGVEASYRYIDRVISPPDEASDETKAAILKKFWSQVTTTSVKLTLKYPF
jgi:hypothetical protein